MNPGIIAILPALVCAALAPAQPATAPTTRGAPICRA
jgi:hypothetical protein